MMRVRKKKNLKGRELQNKLNRWKGKYTLNKTVNWGCSCVCGVKVKCSFGPRDKYSNLSTKIRLQ